MAIRISLETTSFDMMRSGWMQGSTAGREGTFGERIFKTQVGEEAAMVNPLDSCAEVGSKCWAGPSFVVIKLKQRPSDCYMVNSLVFCRFLAQERGTPNWLWSSL